MQRLEIELKQDEEENADRNATESLQQSLDEFAKLDEFDAMQE